GRDMFAPVAAHLAAGVPLREAGDPLAVEELEQLELPSARVWNKTATAHALVIDGFGNVSLNLGHSDLLALGVMIGDRLEVSTSGGTATATFVRTFADVQAGEIGRASCRERVVVTGVA